MYNSEDVNLCEISCVTNMKENFKKCPCQTLCPDGCPCEFYQCEETTTPAETTTSKTTTTTTKAETTTAPSSEKDVLVLSTYSGEKTPMIISFNGKSIIKMKKLFLNIS